jgi:hypothetical protein
MSETELRAGAIFEQVSHAPGYRPTRVRLVRPSSREGWWIVVYDHSPSERPVQSASLLDDRLWRRMTPSPTPEELTMVSNEPSPEAVEAAHRASTAAMFNFTYRGQEDDHLRCEQRKAHAALTAAYRIDAPAIHAAGVAEGRAAMRDEMLTALRVAAPSDSGLTPAAAVQAAAFLWAAFPTTGGQTDG